MIFCCLWYIFVRLFMIIFDILALIWQPWKILEDEGLTWQPWKKLEDRGLTYKLVLETSNIKKVVHVFWLHFFDYFYDCIGYFCIDLTTLKKTLRMEAWLDNLEKKNLELICLINHLTYKSLDNACANLWTTRRKASTSNQSFFHLLFVPTWNFLFLISSWVIWWLGLNLRVSLGWRLSLHIEGDLRQYYFEHKG